MYKVIFKGKESWFEYPIVADEVIPAEGWEVESFSDYNDAYDFILTITSGD